MDTIFNNRIHKLRRERAFKNWNNFSYLKKISTERIYERLYEVRRDFDLGLELGSHYGELMVMLILLDVHQLDYVIDRSRFDQGEQAQVP